MDERDRQRALNSFLSFKDVARQVGDDVARKVTEFRALVDEDKTAAARKMYLRYQEEEPGTREALDNYAFAHLRRMSLNRV